MMTAEGFRGRLAHDPFLIRRFIQIKLQDHNLNIDDETRKQLSEFAQSDPMNDLGKLQANGPRDVDYLWQNNGWHIDKSGHRMLYRLDEETGNKKLVELRDPAGRVKRRFDDPELDRDNDVSISPKF